MNASHAFQAIGFLFLCGVVSACEEKSCEGDENCPSGQRCVAGKCTARDDGTAREGVVALRECVTAGFMCAAWEECVREASTLSCVNAGYQLLWLSPLEGSAFNTAQLPGRLRVRKAMGGTVALREVPVRGATGGVFRGNMGHFRGTLQLGEEEGLKEYVAGWEGGPTAKLTVTLDKTPPQVAVQVEGRPETFVEGETGYEAYWKKDEAVTIRVTVDGGPPPRVGQVISAWGAKAKEGTCTGSCEGNCRCFALPLDAAPLNAFRGEVRFSVEGVVDVAGNAATPVDAGVQLTRFKWQRTMQLASNTTSMLPLTLTETGLVLWGVPIAAGNTPRLEATQPDGGKAWAAITAGTVTAGPVVGTNNAWVGVTTAGANSGTTQLQRLALKTGAMAHTRCVQPAGGQNTPVPFTGAMALASLDGGSTRAPVALRNNRLEAPLPQGCHHSLLATFTDAANSHVVVTEATAGKAAVFVAAQGHDALWKSVLSATELTSAGKASLPSSTMPRGLLFDARGRVGGGGSSRNSTGVVFSTDAGAALENSSSFTSSSAADAGAPVLGHDFILWGDSSGKLHRVPYSKEGTFGSEATQLQTTHGDFQRGAMPLLGTRGQLYVVGPSGKLSVHRSENLQEAWNTPLAQLTGTGNVSQLALDVYRKADGSKDCSINLGVLYVVTRSGTTATLHALLVDSPGLAGNAPWPKYQRDNANRGNVSLPLTPWTCP